MSPRPPGAFLAPSRRELLTVLAPLTAISLLLTLALAWVTSTEASARAWAQVGTGSADASVYVPVEELSPAVDLLTATDDVTSVSRAAVTEVLVTGSTTLAATASTPSGQEVVVAGRLPRTATEVAVDQGLARADGLAPGASVRMSTESYSPTSEALSHSTVELTVVGVVASAPPVFANGYHRVIVTPDGFTGLGTAWYARLDVGLAPGADVSATSAALGRAAPDAVLLTHADETDLARQALAGSGLLQAPVVLGMAAVVLVVGTLSAHNALRTLTARRTRSLALLRALGMRRQELRRRLLLEAVVLGGIASGIGTAAGLVMEVVVLGLVRATAWDVLAPAQPATHPALALVVVAPVLAAAAAGTGPARAGSQVNVAPGAAPGGDEGLARVPVRRTVPPLIVGSVLLLAAARVAALRADTGWDLAGTAAPWGLGLLLVSAALATGALMVSSARTLPATSALMARPVRALVRRRDRPVVDLALGALRARPARTGLVASALLMTVTLTVAVLTVQGGARATVLRQAHTDWAIDLEVRSTASPGPGLTEAAVSAGCAVAGTTVCLGAEETDIRVLDDVPLPALSLSGRDLARLTSSASAATLLDDESLVVPSYVAEGLGVTQGEQVAVAGAGTLTVHVTDLGLDAVVITPSTAATIRSATGRQAHRLLLARLGPDRPRATYEAVMKAVGSAMPTRDRPWVQATGAIPSAADQLTDLRDRGRPAALACLLLLVVVVVTMGGTARLEAVERAHERALLHALGLTRRQLRLMALTETGLVAAVSAFAGVLLGTVGGWMTALVLDTTGSLPLVRLNVGAILLCGVVVPATVVAETAVTVRRATRANAMGPPTAH